MEALDELRRVVETMPAGNHTLGLDAVLRHLAAAERLLLQRNSRDDSGDFADVIYRTNQAYEGLLKEAYQILSGKEPNRMRIADMERYFEKSKSVGYRVAQQMRIYRDQWRNASAHDHKLTFDKTEAYLAVVTVAAIGRIIIDGVSARLAICEGPSPNDVLLEQLIRILNGVQAELTRLDTFPDESTLIQALACQIEVLMPDAEVLVHGGALRAAYKRAFLYIGNELGRIKLQVQRARSPFSAEAASLAYAVTNVKHETRDVAIYLYGEPAMQLMRGGTQLSKSGVRITVLWPALS